MLSNSFSDHAGHLEEKAQANIFPCRLTGRKQDTYNNY